MRVALKAARMAAPTAGSKVETTAAWSEACWADRWAAHLVYSRVDLKETKLAAHWALPMADSLALPTAAQLAEPRAGCWVGPSAAETVGSRANWTAEWSAVLLAVMRAAKMVVQTALSRVDSKVEKTAVC